MSEGGDRVHGFFKQQGEPESAAVADAFSRAAAEYDQWSVVQREAAERLVSILPLESEPRRIVDLGCGTGLSIAALHARFPEATIDGVDIAPAMIRLAERRLEGLPGVSLHAEDAAAFLSGVTQDYDIVFSNFALQWTTDRRVLEAAARRLAPGRVLALCVPIDGSLEELFSAMRIVEEEPRSIFQSAEQWRAAIESTGFAIDTFQTEMLGAFYRSGREALRAVHRIGAARALDGARSPLAPGVLRRVLRTIEAAATRSDRVRLSYRVLWCLARRAAE